MAPRQTAEQVATVQIELRFGTSIAADGRKGTVAFAGEMDREFPGWFRQLRTSPLPAAVGGVQLYVVHQGGTFELVHSHTELADEPRLKVVDLEPVAVVDQQRALEVDRLAARKEGLEQQLAWAQERVSDLRSQRTELQQQLATERAYVAEQKAQLNKELSEARETARVDKARLLEEVGQFSKHTRDEIAAQANLVQTLQTLEGAAAELATTRKLAASNQTTQVLDNLAGLEKHKLDGGSKSGEILAEATGQWIKEGGPAKLLTSIVAAVKSGTATKATE